jgi:hypothetical protein
LSAANARALSRTVTAVDVMISKRCAELAFSPPAASDRGTLALTTTGPAVALDESKSGSIRLTIANRSVAGAASADSQRTVAFLMGACEASTATNTCIGVRSSLMTLEQLLRSGGAMA